MDETERRLTEALHAEADSVPPSGSSWSGAPSARRRPATWLAVAAAVAVIAGGVTLAVHRTGGSNAGDHQAAVASTASVPASSVGSARASHPVQLPPLSTGCNGGWTGNGSSIITGPGQTVPAGTSAILRFADGTPGKATLCALVAGPDSATLASGSADNGEYGFGYLFAATGATGAQDVYLMGAFDTGVASVTFTQQRAPWTLTVSASTPGVTELGSGWQGFAILAPARTADIDVFGTAVDGSRLSGGQLSFGASTRMAPLPPSVSRPVSTATEAPSPAASSKPRTTAPTTTCSPAHAGAAVGITDVGRGNASIQAGYNPVTGTLCFTDFSGSFTYHKRAGALPFSGTTELAAGPGIWGAVTSAASSVQVYDTAHPGGRSAELWSLSNLRFFYSAVTGPATVKVLGSGSKVIATATY